MRALLALLLCLLATPALAGLDPLREAARTGDLASLQRLLDEGADPNAWPDSSSPLMFAAGSGQPAAVALLLAHGAAVDHRDHNGERALLWAARDGNAAVVALLLRAGAAPDSDADPYGDSPLLQAARYGRLEAARLLLAAGAEVERQSIAGWTPLYAAVLSREAAVVALLLDAGARPDPPDSRARATPLHEAARYDEPAILRLLLAAGADVDARDHRGQTPLHVAALRNGAEVALLLLAAGADPDARDENGRTPILLAIGFPADQTFDYGSVAGLLAERSDDLDRAFAAALWGELPSVAGLLLARGASPDAVDELGRPALAAAARLPGDAALRRLIAAGADLARYGGDALGEAAAGGRTDLALILLQQGVAVETRDEAGATALLRAAGAGQVEMVRWLLAAGADPHAVDAAGRGAEDYMTVSTGRLTEEIESRRASRALKPTAHLEIEVEDLEARFAEIRTLLAAAE